MKKLKIFAAIAFVALYIVCVPGAKEALAKGGRVLFDYLQGTEQAAPAVSNTGQAVLYVDSTTHEPNISTNGGAFKPIIRATGGVVPVANGGTGIASGTSGGIPYFSGTTTIASSGALTQHAIVVGGGAGATPTPVASLGTSNQVLHGAAAGDPTWSAVSLTADVSGTLPATSGGTGTGTVATGDLLYGSGTNTWSKLAANATGNNQWLRDVSAGVPTWNAITCSDVTGLGTGGLLYGNVSTGTALAIGTAGQVLTVNAGATAPAWVSPTVNKNWLIDGGFDFYQRLGPSTSSTFTTAGNYAGPDRWKGVAESNSVIGTRTAASSGNSAVNEGTFTSAGGGKFAMWQTLEYADTKPLRSQTVTFQILMKASTNTTMRIGVFEWTSTADSPTNLWTNPTTATGTDPSKNANWAALTATNLSNTAINATPGNSAGDCSVTTSWQTFAVTVAVGSSTNNLAVSIWSNADLTSTQTLSTAQAGLYQGALLSAWIPRQPQQELAMCQRYCYAITTQGVNETIATGKVGTTSGLQIVKQLPVSMRIVPSLTNTTASDWHGDDGADAALNSFTLTAAQSGLQNVFFSCGQAGTTWTAGRACYIYSTAAGKFLVLDADF